jgi:hypothetical protein
MANNVNPCSAKQVTIGNLVIHTKALGGFLSCWADIGPISFVPIPQVVSFEHAMENEI